MKTIRYRPCVLGRGRLDTATVHSAEARNPKLEIRNKFKFPMAQCSKRAGAHLFWSFPSSCLGFVSGFGFGISDLGPQSAVVVSRCVLLALFWNIFAASPHAGAQS